MASIAEMLDELQRMWIKGGAILWTRPDGAVVKRMERERELIRALRVTCYAEAQKPKRKGASRAGAKNAGKKSGGKG